MEKVKMNHHTIM